MPRYFFQLRDGKSDRDVEGTELAGIHEARLEGARLIGGCLQDEPGAFWTEAEWQLDVSDERDLTLFTVLIWGFQNASGRFLTYFFTGKSAKDSADLFGSRVAARHCVND